MKHIKLFLTALLCLVASGISRADDTPIPVDQLPASVKEFVKLNFEGRTIIYAEKDWNSYECRLDDGSKLEFTKKGEWKKVDCKTKAVPEALIPATITAYVNANFAGNLITKIEKERYGYDIELSNDLDLKFGHQGEFLGIDD